ncbi:MAG: hypothetical protein ACREOU_06555 [Candidatus Eiseniibacteriota bacterium]
MKGLASGDLTLVIVAAVLARAAYVLIAPIEQVAFRSTDDAYYYFQVARNFALGHGLTFDGLHPTNGFHPLWMLLLLPVYGLWGADPVLALRAVFVLVAIVAGVAAWFACRVFRRLGGAWAAGLGLLFLVQPFVLYPMVNGLETGVLIACLFALLDFAQREDPLAPGAAPGAAIRLGALLGLTMLARLDSVFLVPAIALVLAFDALARDGSRGLPGLVRKGVLLGLPFVLVVAPYLVWNRATFGHWVPISGAVKSTFPSLWFEPGELRGFRALYGFGQVLFVGAALVLCAALARRAGGRAGTRSRLAETLEAIPGRTSFVLLLAALGLANLLHAAYTVLFVAWGTQWWHFASYLPATLCLAVLGVSWVDRLIGRRGLAYAGAAAVLVVALFAGASWEKRQRGDVRTRWHEAALWARAHLPGNAVLAMTDCGYFAYFCGRPVVNLDGIINGYEYQDALATHRLEEFLARSHVTHVGGHAVHYEADRYVIRLPAWLARGSGSAIVARPEAEIWRSESFPRFTGSGRPDVVRYTFWDASRVHVVADMDTLDKYLSSIQSARP